VEPWRARRHRCLTGTPDPHARHVRHADAASSQLAHSRPHDGADLGQTDWRHVARRQHSTSQRVGVTPGDDSRHGRRRHVAPLVVVGLVVGLVVGAAAATRTATYRQVRYRLSAHASAPVSLGVATPPTSMDDLGSATSSTTGSASDATPLRFAVAGDIGTGGAAEYATADAMDALEGDVDYRALLLLGDNVYADGDPSRVEADVFAPFAGVLDGDTQVLPVLGNHDVDSGFGPAQAAALGMPGPWYSTDFGDVVIIALDSNRADDPEQLAWLEQTLATASERWKIVIMHHPAYSGGYHGSDLRVRNAFTPLFERYGVQLVLAGHDHDYQRSRPIGGVTYVVSGGAATLRPAHLADFSAAAFSVYHFVDITVLPDDLDLRAVDQQLQVIDEVTLAP
jgi:hypothetical protein